MVSLCAYIFSVISCVSCLNIYIVEFFVSSLQTYYNYHSTLNISSRPYRRMKLMVVGEPNMGKTSLLLNLVKKGRVKRFVGKEMSSIDCQLTSSGVELGDWEYSQRGKSKITFMTWDFGGQVSKQSATNYFLWCVCVCGGGGGWGWGGEEGGGEGEERGKEYTLLVFRVLDESTPQSLYETSSYECNRCSKKNVGWIYRTKIDPISILLVSLLF